MKIIYIIYTEKTIKGIAGEMNTKELPKCPIETTIKLTGCKWKILIIRDLLDGTKRFSQLKKSVKGITQKVLTSNLREMEDN